MLYFVRKRVIFFPSFVTVIVTVLYFKNYYVYYDGFNLCIVIEIRDDAVNQFEMHFLLLLHEWETSEINRYAMKSVVFLCSRWEQMSVRSLWNIVILSFFILIIVIILFPLFLAFLKIQISWDVTPCRCGNGLVLSKERSSFTFRAVQEEWIFLRGLSWRLR
jgi:hypothetical protein